MNTFRTTTTNRGLWSPNVWLMTPTGLQTPHITTFVTFPLKLWCIFQYQNNCLVFLYTYSMQSVSLTSCQGLRIFPHHHWFSGGFQLLCRPVWLGSTVNSPSSWHCMKSDVFVRKQHCELLYKCKLMTFDWNLEATQKYSIVPLNCGSLSFVNGNAMRCCVEVIIVWRGSLTSSGNVTKLQSPDSSTNYHFLSSSYTNMFSIFISWLLWPLLSGFTAAPHSFDFSWSGDKALLHLVFSMLC